MLDIISITQNRQRRNLYDFVTRLKWWLKCDKGIWKNNNYMEGQKMLYNCLNGVGQIHLCIWSYTNSLPIGFLQKCIQLFVVLCICHEINCFILKKKDRIWHGSFLYPLEALSAGIFLQNVFDLCHILLFYQILVGIAYTV